MLLWGVKVRHLNAGASPKGLVISPVSNHDRPLPGRPKIIAYQRSPASQLVFMLYRPNRQNEWFPDSEILKTCASLDNLGKEVDAFIKADPHDPFSAFMRKLVVRLNHLIKNPQFNLA
jgi:hypothetical protein